MKHYFTLLLVILHCNLHGKYSNSFILIRDNLDNYSLRILPLEIFDQYKHEIKFDTIPRNEYNGSFSIIKDGVQVKYFDRVNLDSTDWGMAESYIFKARNLIYSVVELPLNYAVLFADSLRANQIYFKTQINLNTPYKYLLDLNLRFIEFPDTVNMSDYNKVLINKELNNQLQKKFYELFPNLEAEISFYFGIPWRPSINIYLKKNEFDLNKLDDLEVKFITKNKIIWRSVLFTLYDF